MKGTVSEMHLHGGWVAFAIFVFIIVILFIFGTIEDAKEKQKSKPQMTYPPKKDNGDFKEIVYEKIDNAFAKIVATGAGIIMVGVPLTILYLIAIHF